MAADRRIGSRRRYDDRPSHTTGRTVFRIRRLDRAASGRRPEIGWRPQAVAAQHSGREDRVERAAPRGACGSLLSHPEPAGRLGDPGGHGVATGHAPGAAAGRRRCQVAGCCAEVVPGTATAVGVVPTQPEAFAHMAHPMQQAAWGPRGRRVHFSSGVTTQRAQAGRKELHQPRI